MQKAVLYASRGSVDQLAIFFLDKLINCFPVFGVHSFASDLPLLFLIQQKREKLSHERTGCAALEWDTLPSELSRSARKSHDLLILRTILSVYCENLKFTNRHNEMS